MSSTSGFGLTGWAEGRASGSSPEPSHATASDAAKDTESLGRTSSSEAPKGTRPLAAEEGCWSSCVKHTSEMKGRGEGRARRRWADVTLLEPREKGPLLRCFFLLGKKGNGKAEQGGPPLWKKAIRDWKQERLRLSQWEHKPSVSDRQHPHCAHQSRAPHSRLEICNNAGWALLGNLLLLFKRQMATGKSSLPGLFDGGEQMECLPSESAKR